MSEIMDEPMAVDTLPDFHPGVEDGAIINDETVVFEFDENGDLTGWHKEPNA